SFSKANLSVGKHTITASVTDSGGLSGSAQVTITVTPLQSAYTFSPNADAKVISSTASTNYGTSNKLEERVSKDTRRGYLKFDVSGLSGTVKSAKMRVYCLRTFRGGDSAYLVSNNYQGTTNPWTERGLNWNNAPSLPSTYLSHVAPVTANTWVEFDVTAAVTGNGVYSFALAHNAATLTYYNTKEAAQNRPVLVIETL
ncbi:MAG TPA: DNRLRE domain-containing protein, partial [Desulfitobacteriaceae bacterium]|nr:DNRLRE domain-containing protein [Desulfitobacteriaceae bacterium]